MAIAVDAHPIRATRNRAKATRVGRPPAVAAFEQTLLERLDRLEQRLRVLEDGQRELLRLVGRAPAADVGRTVDGPVAPDKLRVGGKLFAGFPRLEWLLLRCLWGRDAMQIGDAMEFLYGTSEAAVESAFASVCKRLNRTLVDHGCGASVHRRAGYVVLDVFRPGGA